MKRYEDFTDGLQQDMDIPEYVWSRYMYTLDHIEQAADSGTDSVNMDHNGNFDNILNRREGYFMNRRQKTTKRTWVKAAAVVGVLTAGTIVFSYADPAAASKLPIIGSIFEQISDDGVYSGNYEGKTVLNEEGKNAEKESADNNSKDEKGNGSSAFAAKNIYTASDQGITITASEVYSDGYSVYLAAEIRSEEGGFSNIPAHYTRRFENKTSKSIYALGTWKTDSDGEQTALNSHDFEGKSIDDHTFIGMMKLDKNQFSEKDGQLQLELSDLYYDDETAQDTASIEPQHRFRGTWKLVVPFSVDTKNCKEIPVNKKNENGFGIQKVFISPNQVIVFTDTPYKTLSPDEYTKEDFNEEWGKQNEDIVANGGKAVTYEEILNERYYDYYELAVYNQDGESLEMQYGDETKTVFALQEHELEKLHIYAGDESHAMEIIKAADEQEAAAKSVLDAEVDLK